jgi:hypothetical protein
VDIWSGSGCKPGGSDTSKHEGGVTGGVSTSSSIIVVNALDGTIPDELEAVVRICSDSVLSCQWIIAMVVSVNMPCGSCFTFVAKGSLS